MDRPFTHAQWTENPEGRTYRIWNAGRKDGRGSKEDIGPIPYCSYNRIWSGLLRCYKLLKTDIEQGVVLEYFDQQNPGPLPLWQGFMKPDGDIAEWWNEKDL